MHPDISNDIVLWWHYNKEGLMKMKMRPQEKAIIPIIIGGILTLGQMIYPEAKEVLKDTQSIIYFIGLLSIAFF